MSTNKRRERDKNIITLIIITFLAVVTLLALLFPVITGNPLFVSSQPNIVSIPRVTTTVLSPDGSAHGLEAKLSLELAGGSSLDVNTRTLQTMITDIMSNLDYDSINGDDSEAYIKTSIKNGLASHIDVSQIENIYITEFQSGDFTIPRDESDDDSPRNEAMHGLFQNAD